MTRHRPPRPCAACGQPIPPSRRSGKTCCAECARVVVRAKANARRREIRRDDLLSGVVPTRVTPARTCVVCGAGIPAGANNNAKFCSTACRQAARTHYVRAWHAARAVTDPEYYERRAEIDRDRQKRKSEAQLIKIGASLSERAKP